MPIIKSLSVNEHFVAHDFNPISRESDDPFYEVLARVNGIDKDNHVVPFGFADGDDRVPKNGQFDSIDEFIDKNMVSDQQSGLHGPGGYLKSLDDEGPYNQCE